MGSGTRARATSPGRRRDAARERGWVRARKNRSAEEKRRGGERATRKWRRPTPRRSPRRRRPSRARSGRRRRRRAATLSSASRPAGARERPPRPWTPCRCVLATPSRPRPFARVRSLFHVTEERTNKRRRQVAPPSTSPARALSDVHPPRPPPPPRRDVRAQDDVLEVIFGHLARDSTPREYHDATLTCVPSPSSLFARRDSNETRPGPA